MYRNMKDSSNHQSELRRTKEPTAVIWLSPSSTQLQLLGVRQTSCCAVLQAWTLNTALRFYDFINTL